MPPTDSPVSAGRSLVHKVYEYLRDGIIEGHLPPGTRLLERELSERLDVSRIPIREALPQLEAEGLITTLPRRGAMVAQLTLRDIDELFSVRTSLEVLSARLASRQAAEHSAALLAPAFARAELATAEGQQAEIAAANAAFHEAIVRLSGSRLLISMMAPISARVHWLFRLTSDRDPGVLCSEHHQLHEAICAGDTELAASLAFVHVESGRRPSLDSLRGVLPAGIDSAQATRRRSSVIKATASVGPPHPTRTPATGQQPGERSRSQY